MMPLRTDGMGSCRRPLWPAPISCTQPGRPRPEGQGRMGHGVLLAALLSVVLSVSGSAAFAQSACEPYLVERGDSLHEIAERVDGMEDYWDLYRANRRAIGRNPNRLRVGTLLQIPCVPGSRTAQVETSAGSDPASVSFLTANGYEPYTGEALKNGGLFTRLVEQAMVRAAPEVPVEIVFVNDRAAHFDVLLPRGAFDAGFPWPSPECSDDASGASKCADYLFSDPFYEIVDGFFSLAGAGYENVIDRRGFQGAKVCRPEGHSADGLNHWKQGIPFAATVEAASPAGCFDRLVRGDVDLVALETRTADYAIRTLGLEGRVVENPHLFELHPLRVAVHRSNQRAPELIEILNRGLKIMLETGEWTSIVSTGLENPEANLIN